MGGRILATAGGRLQHMKMPDKSLTELFEGIPRSSEVDLETVQIIQVPCDMASPAPFDSKGITLVIASNEETLRFLTEYGLLLTKRFGGDQNYVQFAIRAWSYPGWAPLDWAKRHWLGEVEDVY